MSRWLLDTNVISELRRPKPSRAVTTFIAVRPLDLLYLSKVTIAEIRYGIEILPVGPQREQATQWLARTIRPMFAKRVLDVDEDVLLTWSLLAHRGRKAGRTYSQEDLLLAATAIFYNMILVTRNTRDFLDLPIQLTNPWE